MTNAYTERILSMDKKFYSTIHDFTSSQGSSRLVGLGPSSCALSFKRCCGNFQSKEWWGIQGEWVKTEAIPNHWTRVTSWTCHGSFRPILQV